MPHTGFEDQARHRPEIASIEILSFALNASVRTPFSLARYEARKCRRKSNASPHSLCMEWIGLVFVVGVALSYLLSRPEKEGCLKSIAEEWEERTRRTRGSIR
jgi:hypothetical protein